MAISTAGSNYFIIHVEANNSKIILAMVIALWSHFIALASPLLSSPMRNVQWQLLNLNVARWIENCCPVFVLARGLFLRWHYLDIFFMFNSIKKPKIHSWPKKDWTQNFFFPLSRETSKILRFFQRKIDSCSFNQKRRSN